ncbi:hypothetical protein FB645_003579 [Coemansia sp. IMI 203386]|nr:hypothetical protein FB645_003579 [Coemansia sp. IMI 203386]
MDTHLESSSLGKVVAEENTNLWETVLKQVGSSKTAAARKVLVLGDSNSGKSKVVAQLFQASLRPQIGNGLDTATSTATTAAATSVTTADTSMAEIDSVVTLSKHDLALSYSYMDVRDEDNEEVISRVGIYQLASDRISDRELLNFVLDAKSFSAAAAVIVLDWSKPWRFVKTLLRWLNVLSDAVDMVCSDAGGRGAKTSNAGGWTQGRAVVDECRERLERFLQEYMEPAITSVDHSAGSALTDGGINHANPLAASADVLLPLAKGVLESNLGLPVVVVCTKSDAMDVMERERGFKEEAFDYIQQVLRAICLRFGAALIYTSTHNPATFSTLYHYLVHRLLTVPHTEGSKTTAGSQDQINDAVSESGDVEMAYENTDVDQKVPDEKAQQQQPQQQQQHQISYPFRVRANVVDRSVVFVPAGWDSAAKIGYLREPFDVLAVQSSWNTDEQRYAEIVDRATGRAAASMDDSETQQSDGAESLLQAYGEVVTAPRYRAGADADGSSVAIAAAAAAGMANQVTVEDDQTFLETLYEEQQDQMALEGEEAEEQNMHNTDAYGDNRMRPGGGNGSARFVTGLLRGGHATDSAAVAAGINDHDSNTGFSDDNSDDLDRIDANISPSSFARQPSMRSESHARSDSIETSNNGSIGRSASARLGRSMTSQAPSSAANAENAQSLRRKLTGNPGEAANTAGGGSSNEELTSFFQNLLGRKGGATPSTTGSSNGKNSPQQQAARSIAGSMSRATGAAGQKDIQADLERWKAQIKRPKE